MTVNVIELPGVRIHSALSRMQTGTKVRYMNLYMQCCKTTELSTLYVFHICIYILCHLYQDRVIVFVNL